MLFLSISHQAAWVFACHFGCTAENSSRKQHCDCTEAALNPMLATPNAEDSSLFLLVSMLELKKIMFNKQVSHHRVEIDELFVFIEIVCFIFPDPNAVQHKHHQLHCSYKSKAAKQPYVHRHVAVVLMVLLLSLCWIPLLS